MLTKEQLTNNIAIPTSDGFERWKIGTQYFSEKAARLGNKSLVPLEPYAKKEIIQLLEDIVRVPNNKNRTYILVNAEELDFEFPEKGFPKDKSFYIGGYTCQTGLDYEIDELRVAISWHDQALERAFDWFKLWMIDRIDAGEMEKILDETEEIFDL